MKKPIVTHRQVRYIVGWTDLYYGVIHEIFVTDDPIKASKWCERFDKLLKKYKEFLKQFEHESPYNHTLLEKYEDEWFERWSDIRNVEGSSVRVLEFR